MSNKEDESTFFVLADEFFFSAGELEKSINTNKVATASYYLYGHSLELAYKSFLYTKGFDVDQLINLGHNLDNALKKSIANGIKDHLDIDDDYIKTVKGINKYYFKKEFEYMTRTSKTYPQLMDIKAIVKKTINSVYNIITIDYVKNA